MSVTINGTTGITLPVTPSQFDNGLAVADTAFVQRALGSFNSSEIITSTIALNAGDLGQAYIIGGSASFVVTLPSISSAPSGSSLTFWSQNSGVVTISGFSVDTIQTNATTQVSSFTLQSGDSATVVSIGGSWILSAGSVQLGYATKFQSSLTSNGYQKLPSGLIMQWGSGQTSSAGTLAITFPITFPTGILQAYASDADISTNTVAAMHVVSVNLPTASGMNVFSMQTDGTISGTAFQWFALGH